MIGAVSGERFLILMNPQSSWLQSVFGTLWESEEEVGSVVFPARSHEHHRGDTVP